MNIGFLNTYHVQKGLQTYQTQYEPMATKYLKGLSSEINLRSYLVAQGEFPHENEEKDLWVISGSPKSAYDNDPWVKELSEWIKKAHQKKKRILGLCFGHQMIAHSLGGKVGLSEKGWGVGVRSFVISSQKKWMKPPRETITLLYSHKDQVQELPPEAEILGYSDFCPVESYSIQDHILCFQGHPEFTKVYARDRMVARKYLLGSRTFNKARKTLKQDCDSSVVGQWVLEWATAP